MKLYQLLLLQICCLLAGITVNGQNKYNIVKVHAYVMETVAGNVQVDDKGNPVRSAVDTLHFIYIETKGKYLPSWEMLYTNTCSYKIQASLVENLPANPGNLKTNNSPVTITPKRGSELWKLELVKVNSKIPKTIRASLKKNAVLLTGSWKGLKFTHTIAKEIELEPIFYE
jgi:hypothetical protein